MTKEPTRWQIVLWIGIIGVLVALSLYKWSAYQVGTYGDDGAYIANADSLIRGAPYGMLLKPNETESSQFPFVFPLLLAPVRAMFPASLDMLRLVPLTATVLALSVLFWGWRYIGRGLSYWWGLATLAVTAISPLTILHARTVMSESIFLLFCLLTIVWVERVVEQAPRGWGILFGLLVVCVVYTRTIGWVFVAVWVAYLIWKLRGAVWAPLGAAALTMAAVLALMVTTTSVRVMDLLPQEYLQEYSSIVSPPSPVNGVKADLSAKDEMTREDNEMSLQTYPQLLVRSLLFHLDVADKLPYEMQIALEDWTNRNGLYILRILPALCGIGLAGLGIRVWIRRTGITAFQVMVPPYVLTLALWSWQGPRLLYPIQAQLFLPVLLGLYTLALFLARRIPPLSTKTVWAVGAPAALVVLLGVGFAWIDLRLPATMLLDNDLRVRAGYFAQNVPDDAVVVDTRAPGDRLYTPQTFIDVPHLTSSTAELVGYLQREHSTFVVTEDGMNPTEQNSHLRTSTSRRFLLALQPLVDSHAVELVFHNHVDDIAIYRVDAQALAKQ